MASHGTRGLGEAQLQILGPWPSLAQSWMGWDVSVCPYLFDTPIKVCASSNQEVLVTASINSVAKMTSDRFPS